MKYWCENCKEVIDEKDLESYEEPSEAWGRIVYEKFWTCPNCGDVPVEYDNQDKTCEDCVLYRSEQCTYYGGRFDEKNNICTDFIGEDD